LELLKQVPAAANLTIVDVEMVDFENKVTVGELHKPSAAPHGL
jgi:hypothetical protein